MYYRIQQMKMRIDHDDRSIAKSICSILGTNRENIQSWHLVKKSIDARDKNSIRIIYALDVEVKKPLKEAKREKEWFPLEHDSRYAFPKDADPKSGAGRRVIIVGGGPAGLFCALLLAEHGYAPLLLERGGDVESRMRSVGKFWESGVLDLESNMQFGEGGAGTFSDGKLNTSVGDPSRRNAKVIEEFLEAGAPPEIAYLSKPHIGTDFLVEVVKNLRKKIESLGGIIRFRAKVASLDIKDGKIRGVCLDGGERIEGATVVLAIGHSARDTFEELSRGPVLMERKPFAIGLRIEHPQAMIQKSQYGASWDDPRLPIADYKLTYQASSGRGVYSFCMCPGGFVVNSSSERGMVACNGMSNFARSGKNANSAIVAAVRAEEFGDGGLLAGMEFQRRWEKAAFEAANPGSKGFAMPAQRLEDFIAQKCSKRFGSIVPSSKGEVALADLNVCLPAFVKDSLQEGIKTFDRKIHGFADPDAVLTGVETRTSSPVRILRNDKMQSNIEGLYPCGEGCGYAGGIMSAAMDGIRVAEAIATAN